MNDKKFHFPKKTMWGIVLGVVALIGGCSFTQSVDTGKAAVGTLFGEMDRGSPILEEGMNVVNPLKSYTTYNLRDQAYEVRGLMVPSQDKFKSSVDITVMYRIDKAHLYDIRQNGGTEEEAVNKYLKPKLLSIVREFGKAVPTAQDLFKAEVQNQLQVGLQRELFDHAGRYGIIIGDIFIQDISLDDMIMVQVKKVKEREEMINTEKAQLAIVEQTAQRDVKQAEARAGAAAQDKMAAQHKADGEFYAAQRDADGKLYAAEKAAEANQKLTSSLTPAILKLKELEVQMKVAESWGGGVPATIMGGDAANAVPLYHLNK